MRMGRKCETRNICDDHRKLFLVNPAYSLSEGSRQRATCNYLYLSLQNGTPDFSIVRYPVGTNWKTYCFTAPLCSRSLPSFSRSLGGLARTQYSQVPNMALRRR